MLEAEEVEEGVEEDGSNVEKERKGRKALSLSFTCELYVLEFMRQSAAPGVTPGGRE